MSYCMWLVWSLELVIHVQKLYGNMVVACQNITGAVFACVMRVCTGGMNGLFAKGAVTELRARQGVCAGNCSTYHC